VFTNIEDQHALVNYIDDWRYQSEVLIHRESEDTHHWLLAWNEKLKTAVYILVELTLATTEGKKELASTMPFPFFYLESINIRRFSCLARHMSCKDIS